MICVYTRDVYDERDLTSVREALRELGFTNKIAYKTYVATTKGLYQNSGNTRVLKYFL